jgi:hypothetical protein
MRVDVAVWAVCGPVRRRVTSARRVNRALHTRYFREGATLTQNVWDAIRSGDIVPASLTRDEVQRHL